MCDNVYAVGLFSFVVVNVGKKMQTCCIGLCVEESTLCIQCLEMYSFSVSKSRNSAFLEYKWSVFHVPASYSLIEMHKLKVVIFFIFSAFLLGQENFAQLNFFHIFGEGCGSLDF